MKHLDCSLNIFAFDGSPNLIFVARKDTRQLIYANRIARETMGVGQDDGLDGLRIDEAFAGRVHVDVSNLMANKFTKWSWFDRSRNRHFQVMSTLVGIDGTEHILQVAVDVSAKYILHQEEQDFDDVSRILNQVVSFLSPSDDSFADNLIATLGIMGQLFHANKASAILCIKPYFNSPTKFEWVNENSSPSPLGDFVTEQFIEDFAHYVSTMERPYASAEEFSILWPQVRNYLQGQGTRAVYLIALRIRDQIFGFILIHNPDRDKIHKLRQVVSDICAFISSAVWNVKHFEMVKKQSSYDLQTNLRNKRSFNEDLSRVNDMSLGVILLDINGLNTINEQHGHAQGDKVIMQAAQLLQNVEQDEEGCCRAYRLGSDKFALIITDKSHISFEQTVKKLQSACTGSIGLSASTGSAWVPKCSSMLASIIAEDAEKELFERKREYYRTRGDANIKYIAENDEFLRSISNLSNIQALVENNNFFVMVQPIFNAKTKKVAYGEALIRLRYEDQLIRPDQFIPLIENLHLSYVVDYFVFREMCKTLSERIRCGYRPSPVATNFSRFTVEREDFIPTIVDTIDSYHLPRTMVVLEVTESASGNNYDTLVETTSRLTDMGFKISLDDFGVAHANLTTLAEFTIGTLKLDKRLIDRILTNEKMRLIVKSLIEMFNVQGISTVAEGVETEEQLKMLQELDCTMIQGFLLSKPLPLNDFLDLSDQSEHA